MVAEEGFGGGGGGDELRSVSSCWMRKMKNKNGRERY